MDSSCGTGGFLVNAMTHVINALEADFSKEIGELRENWDNDTLRTFQDRVSDMAKTNYYGFDINPDLVKATKMNMVNHWNLTIRFKAQRFITFNNS